MGCLPSCLGYAQPRVSHTQTYLNQTGTQPKSPDLAFEGFSWGGMRNLCLCSLSSAQIGAQLWAQNHRLPQLTDPHGITSQMAEHPRHSSRRAFLSCPYAFLFVLPTVKSSRRGKKDPERKKGAENSILLMNQRGWVCPSATAGGLHPTEQLSGLPWVTTNKIPHSRGSGSPCQM